MQMLTKVNIRHCLEYNLSWSQALFEFNSFNYAEPLHFISSSQKVIVSRELHFILNAPGFLLPFTTVVYNYGIIVWALFWNDLMNMMVCAPDYRSSCQIGSKLT